MKKDKIILEAEDISVSFTMYDKWFSKHELTVIKKLNVTVHEGEILAIVGASGSGKSVLSRLLAGYDEPTEGEILWKGESSRKKAFVLYR